MKRFHYKSALAALALLTSLNTSAQSPKSYSFGAGIGYDFKLEQGGFDVISIQPEFGKYFNKQFYLGAGTGLLATDEFSRFQIPLFVRAEVGFPQKGFTPYISLQGGYDINVSGSCDQGRINPSFGVKFPIAKNTDLNLGFGYTHTFHDGTGENFLGFKAGFTFYTGKNGGHGFSKFMKSLEYTAEIETYTSMSSTYESARYKHTDNNIYGVRFSALAPLPVENLYAGMSLGFGHYTCEEEYSRQGNLSEDNAYINVMARVKYKAKQLSITDRIYPFAQVDAGLDALYDAIGSIQPAVGIAIETKGDNSIDISAGYATRSISPTENKGSLRIAVGYTF